MYGGERVYFDKEEIRQIKTQFGDPGLKLLGFKDQSRLKPYHHVKHSSFLYPDDESIQGVRTCGCPWVWVWGPAPAGRGQGCA